MLLLQLLGIAVTDVDCAVHYKVAAVVAVAAFRFLFLLVILSAG